MTFKSSKCCCLMLHNVGHMTNLLRFCIKPIKVEHTPCRKNLLGTCLLCISSNERVLRTSFAGRNHLLNFHNFFHQLWRKKRNTQHMRVCLFIGLSQIKIVSQTKMTCIFEFDVEQASCILCVPFHVEKHLNFDLLICWFHMCRKLKTHMNTLNIPKINYGNYSFALPSKT